MTERSTITSRLMSGLIVLSLGVLWLLDNLGAIDASRVIRWWPLLVLAWGLMCLTGIGRPRRTIPGVVWSLVGVIGLLDALGVLSTSVFDLWPVLLIALGTVLVLRATRGAGNASGAGGAGIAASGPRLNAFAFLGGCERKVVAQDFRSGDVSAIMGAAVVDFRPAQLAGRRAEVDVFAALGGIDLIVPTGWRVVGEVTPVLGAFQDSSAQPTDPAAPLLVVRGTVVMGGVEVLNENRKLRRHGSVIVESDATGRRRVVVGPGGIILGAVKVSQRDRPADPSAPRPADQE